MFSTPVRKGKSARGLWNQLKLRAWTKFTTRSSFSMVFVWIKEGKMFDQVEIWYLKLDAIRAKLKGNTEQI